MLRAYFLLLLCLPLLTIAQQDRFAKIGGQSYSLQRDLLIEPAPMPFQPVALPGGIRSQPLAFRPDISTAAELYKELDSMRRVFAPFLKQYHPLRESFRSRLYLDSMQWRKQTEPDKRGLDRLFAGDGQWENVRIPHFGPPVGHAVTYYRKQIVLQDSMLNKGRLFFCFRGVDYKAEVYVNGQYCGSHEGFFAPFEFDVTNYVSKGINTLVVKVVNEPTTTGSADGLGNHVVGDKIYAAGGLGYDEPEEGWHLCPPAMGIYQDCFLEARPDLFVHDVFVRPDPKNESAEVWLELYNARQLPENATVELSLLGRNFRDTIFMNREFQLSTTMVPGIGDMVKPTDWSEKPLKLEYGINYIRIPISVKNVRWWSPDQPWLYTLHVGLKQEGRKKDIRETHFGMRTFTMDTVQIPKGMMYLNGAPVRLRGANSMGFEQNDVFKKDWKQLMDDILLARLCNMNYLRFTQRPVQDEVYTYCDMLGMMNQTDLPFFGAIRVSQFNEAVKQAGEMEKLIRPHPSAIMVTYINERFPNAEGSPHRSFASVKDINSVFTALDQAILLKNPDRVIKAGDGDYDPPSPGLPDNHCYNTWYNGHALDLGKFHKGYWQLIKPDWLYGCGEFGAEGLDPVPLMKKYYPASWLPANAQEDAAWTPNKISKAQSRTMHYMWYPTPKSLSGWVEESQTFQQWAVKLVAERFRRDPRNVSCAVHLFIDAWPAGWMKAIMDVDRQPKKAYFAYRNALAPLMVSLRSDRRYWNGGETGEMEVWIGNDRNVVPAGVKIGYEVWVDGKPVLRQLTDASIPLNSARYQGTLTFRLPEVKTRTRAIVKAGLFSASGECLHMNQEELVVFPKASPMALPTFVFSEGRAQQLLEEAKLKRAETLDAASLLLIDDYQQYKAHEKQIDAFVQKGGKVMFLELPKGSYNIGGTKVDVEPTIMGEYFFANTEERLLRPQALDAKDVFLWYDREKGYIQPLLKTVFRAERWTPLVTTGLCNFGGNDPAGYLAAAELKAGKGRYIVSAVCLSGRLPENPPARQLFLAMLKNE